LPVLNLEVTIPFKIGVKISIFRCASE